MFKHMEIFLVAYCKVGFVRRVSKSCGKFIKNGRGFM
ncbi:hypothetical protein NSE_0562 [Neorickettsia sennetsu str. Miyayama]|uniref:Uncharacterized protein n=1 Tax=Ehrlichia sennetsu (strain ATCC VR-367 / Miyayama) TaxID=222891 RepID=Q2GDK2_EHRS3|nr:hypothetical protein NSE_0562 [Neorickettsia sennetsu str. Miyayama]